MNVNIKHSQDAVEKARHDEIRAQYIQVHKQLEELQAKGASIVAQATKTHADLSLQLVDIKPLLHEQHKAVFSAVTEVLGHLLRSQEQVQAFRDCVELNIKRAIDLSETIKKQAKDEKVAHSQARAVYYGKLEAVQRIVEEHARTTLGTIELIRDSFDKQAAFDTKLLWLLGINCLLAVTGVTLGVLHFL